MLIDADDWCLLLDNAEIIFSSHLKNFNFVSFKIKKRNLWKSSFMKCCSLWILFIIMWKIINTYNFCRGLVEFYSNLCRGSYALCNKFKVLQPSKPSSNGWKNFMHSFFFFFWEILGYRATTLLFIFLRFLIFRNLAPMPVMYLINTVGKSVCIAVDEPCN